LAKRSEAHGVALLFALWAKFSSGGGIAFLPPLKPLPAIPAHHVHLAGRADDRATFGSDVLDGAVLGCASRRLAIAATFGLAAFMLIYPLKNIFLTFL
jgi:hypothetical protein